MPPRWATKLCFAFSYGPSERGHSKSLSGLILPPLASSRPPVPSTTLHFIFTLSGLKLDPTGTFQSATSFLKGPWYSTMPSLLTCLSETDDSIHLSQGRFVSVSLPLPISAFNQPPHLFISLDVVQNNPSRESLILSQLLRAVGGLNPPQGSIKQLIVHTPRLKGPRAYFRRTHHAK